MTETTDFTIYAGEDWPQTFKYWNNDTPPTGTDLGNDTIVFYATTGDTPLTMDFSYTTPTDVEILNQTTNAGEFKVNIAGTDTSTHGGKIFYYELNWTHNGKTRVIYPAPGTVARFNVVTSLIDSESNL